MTSKLAVVTGATGTLGRLVTADLVARGMTVIAVSRGGFSDPPPSHEVSGVAPAPMTSGVISVAADLAYDVSIEAIRAALPEGDVVMAVHAVGLSGSPGVVDVDPNELGAAVNLKAGGLLRLIRAVTGRLGEGSRVIAVGGHLGQEPSEHAPLAGVGNAALANLVRQLVRPLADVGASVHLVAPGPFDSPRVQRLMEAKAAGSGVTVEQQWQRALASYPHGRMPRADEVASVISLLLAPAAATLTGSMLALDGGIRRGIF